MADNAITNLQDLPSKLNKLKETFENKLFSSNGVTLNDINEEYTTYLNNTNESQFEKSTIATKEFKKDKKYLLKNILLDIKPEQIEKCFGDKITTADPYKKKMLDIIEFIMKSDNNIINDYNDKKLSLDELNEIISNTNIFNNTDNKKNLTHIYLHDDYSRKYINNEHILVFNYKIYMINNFEKKKKEEDAAEKKNKNGRLCDYVKIYILYRLVFYSLKICINLTKINGTYNYIIKEYYENINLKIINEWHETYISNPTLFDSIFKIFIDFFEKLKDMIIKDLNLDTNKDKDTDINKFLYIIHYKIRQLLSKNDMDNSIKIYEIYKAFNIYTEKGVRVDIEDNEIYKKAAAEEEAARKAAEEEAARKAAEEDAARKAAEEEAAEKAAVEDAARKAAEEEAARKAAEEEAAVQQKADEQAAADALAKKAAEEETAASLAAAKNAEEDAAVQKDAEEAKKKQLEEEGEEGEEEEGEEGEEVEIPYCFQTYANIDNIDNINNITILYKSIKECKTMFNLNYLLKSYNYLIYINNGKIEVFKIKRYYNLKHILKYIYIIYKDIIIISKKIASIHSSEFLYQYNKYLSVNLIFIYKNIGETDINNLPNFKKIILDNKNTLNITIVNCNFIKNVIYKDSNEKAQQNTIVHSKQAQLSAALDFLKLFHSSQTTTTTAKTTKTATRAFANIASNATSVMSDMSNVKRKASAALSSVASLLQGSKNTSAASAAPLSSQSQQTHASFNAVLEVIKLFHSSSQDSPPLNQIDKTTENVKQQAPLIAPPNTSQQLVATFCFLNLFHNLPIQKSLDLSLTSSRPRTSSQASHLSLPPSSSLPPPLEEQGITYEKIKDASFNAALEVIKLFYSSSQSPQATYQDLPQLIIEEQAPLKIPKGAPQQLKATFNFLNLFHNLLTPKLLDLSLTSNVETPPEAAEEEEARQKAAEEAQTEVQKEAQPEAQPQIVKQALLKIPEEAPPQLKATFNFLNLFHS